MNALSNRAIDAYMLWTGWTVRRPFLSAARRVKATQHELLRTILQQNADTTIGRRYDFRSITSLEVYRERVPIHTFDDLADLAAEQQNGVATLTASDPVYYARTSGTTGRSKDIPLTSLGLAQIRDVQRHLAFSLWRRTDFMKGALLAFASPANEGQLANGKAYGSTSGSTYRSLSPIIERKFVMPRATFSIADPEDKYRIYALAVLSRGDITGAVAANPSSILKVTTIIQHEAEALLHVLREGGAARFSPDAEAVAALIKQRADQRRVRTLQEALGADHTLEPALIWPRLSAIATWTGGSCGTALQPLRQRLPRCAQVVEYGYGASEFMGTATIDARANICLPLLTHNVYEFVRREDWDAGHPIFLGLHELTEGEDYYIFATTQSGLYRYNINDIVRATRGAGQCPGLQFLQKGRGVTSITGEKLSEHQLIAAVEETLSAQNLAAASYLALADEPAARYVVFLEIEGRFDAMPLADALDERLRALNSEYSDKRASGRLGPVVARCWRMGAGDQVRRWALEKAPRDAQYKPVLLDYMRNWSDRLPELELDRLAS